MTAGHAAKPEPIREKHQAAIDALFGHPDTSDDTIDLINALLTDAEDIEAQRDEYETERDEAIEEVNDHYESQFAVLEHVKYWMHNALVLHRPMTDPRVIMRMLEDATR